MRVTCLNNNGMRPDIEILERGEPIVYAFWHGRQFLMFNYIHKSKAVVLASLSEGGEVQQWVLRSFGYSVARGSSTRKGASGLIQVIRHVKKGRSAAFAVDGPRGPVFKAKPGVIQVTSKSDAYLLPLSISYRKCKVLKNVWDCYHFPLPFTQVAVKFGKPRKLPKKLSEKQIEQETDKLSRDLNRLTHEVDAYFAEYKQNKK